jgi:opacity protein-like surface antigen
MYKKVVLLLSVALLSQTTQAASVVGLVSSVGCHNIDNSCWVQVEGAPSSQFCNNSTQLRWDAGTSYGARWYATFLASVAGFAYLEPTDSNYSTFVSVILLAKAQGLSVAFYGNLDGSGYCRLRHVGMP